MEVHALGINGSPHDDGVVSQLLESVLNGAREEGTIIDMIRLYDHRIDPTPGNYSRDPKTEASARMPDDDMTRSILPKVQNADILVLATPCYWANMSGVMKTFIDRLTPMENNGFGLLGKVAAFVAASKENEGGVEMAAMSMVAPLAQMGVLVPPGGILWSPGDWVNAKEAVPSWAMHDAPLVGKDLVRIARLLKEQSFTWSLG